MIGTGWLGRDRARRTQQAEQVRTLLIAGVIGALAAVGAIAFRAMVLGAEFVFWGTGDFTVDHVREVPWMWRLVVPAIGGLLIAPIVMKWATDAKGSGIPEVIESVALRGGVVPGKIVPLKAIAAALTIGSGGSSGREGPIVHVGAAIASWIAQRFHASAKQLRTFVGCGVAGGIAATFNTPFTGALFAVEVVLGDFGTARIAPIVISSIVATVISRHYSGNFPHLDVPAFDADINLFTLTPFLLLGLVCAVVSAFFIKMMGWGWRIAGRWPFHPWLMPAVGGLSVGLIGLFFPHVYGVGYDTINAVLEDRIGITLLVLLVGAKILATTATLTSGGSGGVFAPSLFIGAAVGSIAGQLAEQSGFLSRFAPTGADLPPHAFALVGMGALVAGTTRAPISAILVIFELTYEPDIILPLMAACIPTVLVSAWIHPDSIYIAKLTHKGVRLTKRSEVNLLKGMRVSEAMMTRVETVAPDVPLMEVVERFLATPYPVLWVVDGKGKLLGVIESSNLEVAMLEKESLMGLITAQDLASTIQARIHPEDDLSFAMRLFDDVSYEILPVMDPGDGTLVADLLRSDVIHAYNRELSVRDNLAVAVDAIGVAERLGNVDLGDGYLLVEYEVPAHLAGRTMKSLDLRARSGGQAILVKRGNKRLVPGPDTELMAGDVVLFAGEARVLEEKLQKL